MSTPVVICLKSNIAKETKDYKITVLTSKSENQIPLAKASIRQAGRSRIIVIFLSHIIPEESQKVESTTSLQFSRTWNQESLANSRKISKQSLRELSTTILLGKARSKRRITIKLNSKSLLHWKRLLTKVSSRICIRLRIINCRLTNYMKKHKILQITRYKARKSNYSRRGRRSYWIIKRTNSWLHRKR